MLMVPRTWRTNPWSFPLVLAGMAFTLTASAYAVMAVQKLGTGAGAGRVSESVMALHAPENPAPPRVRRKIAAYSLLSLRSSRNKANLGRAQGEVYADYVGELGARFGFGGSWRGKCSGG